VNLRQASLKNANLGEAYLVDADLREANLESADLEDANLERAVLIDANLTRANLEGANLAGANLAGARLRLAQLATANLTGADLRDAIVTHADLSEASLGGIKASGADFTGTNLRGALLVDADFTRATLNDASLAEVRAGGAKLGGASLQRADLTAADLTNADLTQADLRRANLTSAILLGTCLTGAKVAGLVGTGTPLVDLQAAWLDASPLGDGGGRIDDGEIPALLSGLSTATSPAAASERRYFGKGDIMRDATLTFDDGACVEIDSLFENCTIALGVGAELVVGRAGVLADCEIAGAGAITVHGQFFERKSPGIVGARALRVTGEGTLVAAVAQGVSPTRFAFDRGCRVRLRIMNPPAEARSARST